MRTLSIWTSSASPPTNSRSTTRVISVSSLRAASSCVLDGSWYAPRPGPVLDVDAVEVNDLFSAGSRVAFHVTQRGRYRGGLAGAPDAAIGQAAALHCVGFARVEGGEVREVRAITDRLGMRSGLKR